MVDFIESIMLYDSILQVGNFVTEHPSFGILVFIAILAIRKVYKKYSSNFCKIDIKSKSGRIRIVSYRDR